MKRLLFTIALIPTLLYAQNIEDSLTAELSVPAGDSAIIGFAAAIIDQDGILYAKGFGFTELKAQEMNMLDLDDDINDYFRFRS